MINRLDLVHDKHLVPKRVQRQDELELPADEPFTEDNFYWGSLDHKGAERILNGLDVGSFLVRQSGSKTPHYTLSVRFNGLTKHFKLFHESGEFFLNAQLKHFKTIDELVEDGLWNYHLEQIHNQETTTARRHVPACVPPRLEHVFKEHTFRGLNWCEACGQFLWSFAGVKCESCSFVAHKKCSEQEAVKLQECVKDPLPASKGPFFGAELGTIVKHDQETALPFVVVHCVKEIEVRGIRKEGIYRVSAFADEVDGLKSAFERHGRSTDISSENLNIHSVAGVLKLFFRVLPTPLIPALLLASLGASDDVQQLHVLKINLLKLPTAHWNCLKFMATHLRLVSSYDHQNKMNAENLATVFAPTLIGIGTDTTEFTDLAREIFLLTFIIKNSNILFSTK